jgi:hypothetical protein
MHNIHLNNTVYDLIVPLANWNVQVVVVEQSGNVRSGGEYARLESLGIFVSAFLPSRALAPQSFAAKPQLTSLWNIHSSRLVCSTDTCVSSFRKHRNLSIGSHLQVYLELKMANYLASIFGTEQDKVSILILLSMSQELLLTAHLLRSTVVSTIRSVLVVTAIVARASMSSRHTARQFSSPTSTRIPPSTPKTK